MVESTDRRLIDVAFPLKQASLDSVHEKNMRHGHISTLHIWPARRPLAASRAALIAALLPDPEDPEKRKEILERMAGRVVEKTERKQIGGRTVENVKEETVGGILHWGREDDPDMDWFRQEISNAYDSKAPKVLDPFAGGGAIPLEAMRLGCDVTALDINPVAWFILKCTLEYPQRLGGQAQPLPGFALDDREFMTAFLKAKGFQGTGLHTRLKRLGHNDDGEIQLEALKDGDPAFEADLVWHMRAWGRWVLAQARKELAPHYPTYAEFMSLRPGKDFQQKPMQLLETDKDGVPQLDPLNAKFDSAYLNDHRNPRWVAKSTIAYLWARTVKCKQCRATVPLLKTRWLCKKDNKRVLLIVEPNADRTGVVFGVETDVPRSGGNAAQRREHDKRIGTGTMSRSGAACPCCDSPVMTMEDIRLEGRAGRLGVTPTVVVVDGPNGKEYRLPTIKEIESANISEEKLTEIYANIPFGIPHEPLPSRGTLGFRVPLYGIDSWRKLFLPRQLATLGILIRSISEAKERISQNYPPEVAEAIVGFLACMMDRQADYGSAGCRWHNVGEKISSQFSRFALPIVWDTAEACPLTTASGGLESAYGWVTKVASHLQNATRLAPPPKIEAKSAINDAPGTYDAIITDPPYYDAIPYSDLMDFFYVWLRRLIHKVSDSGLTEAFLDSVGPKWDHQTDNGELIDDASRFGGDREKSKANYENGMYRALMACHGALKDEGRMVIVFANKQPDAWETLVSALIRAGFVVTSSWPIQTEMKTRTRAMASAALSSSVWLVCRKRLATTRPGWDNVVLGEMRQNITRRLRDFWDAGIRGPDFVWAATGPALEAFSKYPVVKKANDPGQLMMVSEFLRDVRRMVVDFVVGRVLAHDGDEGAASGLDDVTTYYLLHRHDFGMDSAPAGACILYAISCNLSDSALVNQFDVLGQPGTTSSSTGNDAEASASQPDEEGGGGSGAQLKLKAWNQRRDRNLGLEAPSGQPIPLIDQMHRLMHLWRNGDLVKVDDYLDNRGLKRNALFNQILQALIELAAPDSEERPILESLSNHVAAREHVIAPRQGRLV